MGNKRRLNIFPTKGGWVVRSAETPTATRTYSTQAEAAAAAREMVRLRGGEVVIQGKDGRLRGSYTLGRESMARISAVEGIRLSEDMTREFRRFDRDRLSDAARRQAIAKAFGKKS